MAGKQEMLPAGRFEAASLWEESEDVSAPPPLHEEEGPVPAGTLGEQDGSLNLVAGPPVEAPSSLEGGAMTAVPLGTIPMPMLSGVTASPGGLPSGFQQGDGKAGQAMARQRASLFGTDLEGSEQGFLVLLDVSESMEAHARLVRRLVERDYPGARVVELASCLILDQAAWERLRDYRGAEDYSVQSYTRMMPASLGAELEAFLAASPRGGSIYVLSDFMDYVDEKTAESLAARLKASGVRVFLHCVGTEPVPAVLRLSRQTGGKVIRKPVR